MQLVEGPIENLKEPGDFTYALSPDPTHPTVILVKNPMCTKRKGQLCNVDIRPPGVSEPDWAHAWNGNLEKPTLQPSIGCEVRGCQFHGFIIDGELS